MRPAQPEAPGEPVTEQAGSFPDLKATWRELISGGSLTMVSQAADIVVSVFVGIFLARHLGKVRLGMFSLTAGLIDMATLISSQTIPMAVTKYLASSSDREERRRLWQTGCIFMLGTSLAAWIVLCAIGPWMAESFYKTPDMAPLFWIAGVLVVFNNLRALVEGLLQGMGRIPLLNKLRLASFAVHLAVVGPLAWKWGVAGALWAAGARTFAQVVLFFAAARGWLREEGVSGPLAWDGAAFRRLFAYSFPAWLSSIFSAPKFWLVCNFIQRGGGMGAVGQFSVAYSLCRNLGIFSIALSLPYIPMVSRIGSRDPETLAHLVPKVQRAMAAVMLPPALLLAIFAPFWLRLVFGEAYVSVAPTLALLAAAFYWAGVIDNISYVLFGLGRMWTGLAANVLSMTWFLMGILLWVPSFGAFGASMAYAAAFALHCAFNVLYVRWALGIRLTGFWSIFFSGGLFFAAALEIQRRLWFGPAFLASAAALIAVMALWVWKVFPREILHGALEDLMREKAA